ncbi:MAG: type II toxin-antitoxin system Phd/YefM family antitoxin [Oscillospiraceae bacterium]|nr:type II toxin-antitoxin system Phd/YefM family antitoxin [Oscillospiraceae bacterium]
MALPKVIPINELKNTSQISKTCEESKVPIVITKNGYGKMVLMSVDLYEKQMAEAELAGIINEAVREEENGAPWIDGDEFFASMKEKYGA